MKKVLAMLTAVLLVSSLAACAPQGDPAQTQSTQPTENQPQMTVSVDSFGTNFDDVHIHVPDAQCKGEDVTLDVSWTNFSEYEVLYGEIFSVQRQEQGQWVTCDTVADDRAFHAIAYVLTSRETRTKTYNPSFMFVLWDDGKYRFETEFSVMNGETAADANRHVAWVEFTVSHSDRPSVTSDQTAVTFDAKYIRTNGYHADVAYPFVNVIRSAQELSAYYEQYRSQYDLERKDNSRGFLDACDQYEASFFAESALLCIVVQEGSGSIQHCVRAVTADADGKLAVDIHRLIPEVGTADMAQWHILVEVPKECVPKTAENILVSLSK